MFISSISHFCSSIETSSQYLWENYLCQKKCQRFQYVYTTKNKNALFQSYLDHCRLTLVMKTHSGKMIPFLCVRYIKSSFFILSISFIGIIFPSTLFPSYRSSVWENYLCSSHTFRPFMKWVGWVGDLISNMDTAHFCLCWDLKTISPISSISINRTCHFSIVIFLFQDMSKEKIV